MISSHPILALAISVFITVFIISDAKSSCDRFCAAAPDSAPVPYPFGFSSGCPIQLNCSSSHGLRLGSGSPGQLQVLNFTPTSILVKLPPKCNRSIGILSLFFGPNYALSRSNSLLLQNCSDTSASPCEIRPSLLDRGFRPKNCNFRSNISCFGPSNNEEESSLLSYRHVNSSLFSCGLLFSSVAVDSEGGPAAGMSLEPEKVRLDWWVNGLCQCDTNARCETMKGISGFRCRCKEGFDGDGFTDGDGCERVTGCSAFRESAGHCGGTTRIGVLVGGIVAGASVMTAVALVCLFFRRKSHALRNETNSAKRLLYAAAGNSSVPFYTFKEIEKATCSFADTQRLGTGAYGTVYAGKMSNDQWVAIKRFRYRDTDSIDQVMNEIKLLSSVSHPNLVRLLGCCVEEGEPILVYEFMPNGTLSEHLQKERGEGLPWTTRVTIAAETAKAVAYLHSAVNPPIFHRDIKSSNILLDYKYKSKVADFGLSRLGMTETSHISTAPQGTPGYLDPQYHQYFHLSDKSDVYSFGVVLVEIITALKVVDFSRPHSEVNLAALAIDRIGRGCVDEIIDPFLDPNRDAWTLSSIHNVAELAFRCLAFHGDMRPSMMEVAEELEQIRLSAWVPNMYMASPEGSCYSVSDDEDESEKSLSCMSVKKISRSSRRLVVPQRNLDSLQQPLEEVKDSSPVSVVQDPWSSEQSSPSTNSLLGNVKH